MVDKSVDQDNGRSTKDQESSQDEGDTVEEDESVASVAEDDEEVDEEEEEEEEDEEPKLKYARLTSHLGAVYRNADATSTFLVAGDKMFIGTHSGNIHVISLPSFQPLRVYHAHSASISSISISPFPPPVNTAVPDAVSRVASQAQGRTPSVHSEAPSVSPRNPRTPIVPKTPANAIYIATSSIDGNVCVASLVDVKDNQLRNFARPVQAVALSPDYKNDRTYISGGQAGNLVLTVGGKSGTSSTSTTTGGAAATATGWLGTIGLGGNSGKDTILHSGEGTISTIKWSRSGKYIVWVNEHGIKLMRSNLLLDSSDTESAWKRIAHIDRPHENGWEEMASVWKPRIEWVDEKNLEVDEHDKIRETSASSSATAKLKQQAKGSKKIEKLLVGWGGTVWIVNVHPDGVGVGKHVGERSVGRAEIIKILRMDCIVSGLSLYTPTLLLVLAYITPDEMTEEKPESKKGHKSTSSTSSEPRGGIRHRQNALSPELRLIDLNTSEEVDTDTLTVSRYERLSAVDYHLDILPANKTQRAVPTSRSTLETLSGMGSGMWNAALSATTLLSSAASVKSNESNGSDARKSTTSTLRGSQSNNAIHPDLSTPGMRIFIHSPYDCILGSKRTLTDHLSWLLEHEKYEQAWQLINQNPEVISESPEKLAEIGPEVDQSAQLKADDFYDDVESTTDSASKLINSAVEKEKRRIGELWIQKLIKNDDWSAAGEVCGQVLNTSKQWEDWVYVFVGKDKFDEITNFVPTLQMTPPIKSEIYEVILAHYIASDRPRAKELLDVWSPILFDIGSVTTVLENQLKYRDVREDSVEAGEVGRDWRIIMESLGKLHVAAGRPREALKYYIHLQDADTAMTLIKEYRLVDAVADDIPGLILLRVSKKQEKSAMIEELQQATAEAIHLLVDEAQRGIVRTDIVVEQLEAKKMPLYLYFYLSALWRGEGIVETQIAVRDRLITESRALVDDHAELAVHLFANYDRELLMEYIKSPTFHTFEKATQECEDRSFTPELIYLYSKTGQTKRALYLIIDKLQDVSQAISFAKDQDDTDLWNDLLDYSMDKPRFIRGLLEEVGTAINPITLVRRIPEGLEIEGLRDGLARMVREYEIQHSISEGVAKVLRGEVAVAQNALRTGQRRGVKFDIERKGIEHVDIQASSSLPLPGKEILNIQEADSEDTLLPLPSSKNQKLPPPGHCIGCREAFTEQEVETLVGFACGHVFHLSHLLNFGEDDDEDGAGGKRPDTPPPDGVDEDGQWRATHSVGAKVTHARLLRDLIRDGCPVCRDTVVAGVE